MTPRPCWANLRGRDFVLQVDEPAAPRPYRVPPARLAKRFARSGPDFPPQGFSSSSRTAAHAPPGRPHKSRSFSSAPTIIACTAAGAPLLLISGLGSRGTSWRPFLQRAAREYGVVTFDCRGAGASPSPAGPFTIRDLARDALALLELALLAPERVERLVLASTTGPVDAHLRQVFLHWAELAESGLSAPLRHRESLLWCLGSAALADPARVGRYLRSKRLGDRPRDYALQARPCAEHDALRRLHRLAVPALVVAGSDDRLMPPRHAEALAKAIPGAVLEGAGHLVHLEAADAFAREVMRFLAAGGPG